ncbi:hypothetical protein AB0G67_27035 [Streptomyces sp. NPDC021056]|uniref:hypothetical protein n=1 Tax=Streptomyces sp. NPDC021056 TaxID=3155012 RepID=UPI0033C27D66
MRDDRSGDSGVIGMSEFALRVLRTVAPEEVAAFEPDLSVHLRQAHSRLRDGGRPSRDIACGSGIELVDVVAPAALYVCVALGAALTEGVTVPLTRATERSVSRLARRLFGRPAPSESGITPGAFTAQQLAAIHADALTEAGRLLPGEQAKTVADGIVACLTLRDGA